MICDNAHRPKRLFANHILKRGDKMALIVYWDRVALGAETDRPPRFAVLQEGEMHFTDFMKKYKFIYENEDNLSKLTLFTKAIIRQRRTYEEENVQKIYDELSPNSDNWHEMRDLLKFGFYKLAKHQYRAFISLCAGYQTPKELTETNIVPNSQWVLDCNDINNKQLNVRNTPQITAPPSFVMTVHKFLHLKLIEDYHDLIEPGFHTFEAQLAAQDSFYQFCITYICNIPLDIPAKYVPNLIFNIYMQYTPGHSSQICAKFDI